MVHQRFLFFVLFCCCCVCLCVCVCVSTFCYSCILAIDSKSFFFLSSYSFLFETHDKKFAFVFHQEILTKEPRFKTCQNITSQTKHLKALAVSKHVFFNRLFTN